MTSLIERWSHCMMDNYGTPPLALVRGSGAVVVDEAGREYVDLLGGIAVNALGHAHPAVVEAVSKQVATLGHVSNLFVSEPAVALAEVLLALVGRPGRVFFANSGAEANEAAFKISRRTGRTQVVHVPYGDAAALESAVSEATAMVILEPIQGENGVVVPPAGYLAAARRITARHGALLAVDEVQTGIGRTGHWLAHQAEGVEPDLVTLAKGLGGGLPIGACLAFGQAAQLLGPGSHGTTFGGNPISCAAALAVISTIANEGLLDHVKRVGERIRRGIEGLGHPLVAGVRGAGLLLGIELRAPVSGALAGRLRDAGFLTNPVQPGVLRLAPPLIITAEQADAFLAALPGALDAAAAEVAPVDALPADAAATAAGTGSGTAADHPTSSPTGREQAE